MYINAAQIFNMKTVFSQRREKLKSIMRSSGLDVFVVTSNKDIYYYTGVSLPEEEAGLLLISSDRPRLFVSPLLAVKESVKGLQISAIQNARQIRNLIPKGRIGFDEYDMRYYLLKKLKKPGTKWIESAERIKEPRMVKDRGEIRMIKKAISLTSLALKGLEIYGNTEENIARRIEASFIENGGEKAFATIVASGKNSSMIHYTPANRVVKRRRPVIIDCGARYSGYCADISRTLCDSCGKKHRRVYEDVRSIQEEIIDHAKEGVKFSELQEIYEKEMKRLGYRVMHSFGHGVGLDVHERPYRSDILRKGMVITVEPGVYIKNSGGVRIEDMIVIRKGRPKILSENVRL